MAEPQATGWGVGVQEYVLELVRQQYRDFGPTLAAEVLLERHGVEVSRETLRKWMVEAELWLSRKQRRVFHQPRLRRESYGELVQIDGSEHRWFENRGEPRSSTRLNGETAVTLLIAKQSGENSVATAKEVKQRINELSATLPKDIKLQVVSDQSVFIEAAVDSIKRHLIEGSFFACIIIFAFLANWRTTLIAALAIPTSIIATFALMAAMGFTLNQITMLALTLMVGIVIDDAIIVLENIYRFIEEKGMPPFQAAIEGTREIGFAVMATTLSLLAVFLPVGFMGGIVGRFMSSFGFTSAFAIAVSLLVSFTLTPMLCSRFIKAPGYMCCPKECRQHY